jgi:hypothetical protein
MVLASKAWRVCRSVPASDARIWSSTQRPVQVGEKLLALLG